MSDKRMTNDRVADVLESVANLLEIQGADAHRIRTYRHGAATVRRLDRPVADMVKGDDPEQLERVKGIGPALSRPVHEIVETGCLGYLERLKEEVGKTTASSQSPEVVQNIRGRIYSGMGTEPLDELNLGPHDLKLDETNALGGTRVHGETNALSGMYNLAETEESECSSAPSDEEPPVSLLLDVDAEYRRKAAAGELRKIAPKENNPDNKKWLPVMELKKDAWFFRVMFSNSDTAHDLDKIFDWVVIEYPVGDEEAQCTVVTSGTAPTSGRRVIRGREEECEAHYRRKTRL